MCWDQCDPGSHLLYSTVASSWGFPGGSDGEESTCNAGDLGLIPGSGRSFGKRIGYPLQYSCLESSMDRGTWRATESYSPERGTESDTTERLTTQAHRSLKMEWVHFSWLLGQGFRAGTVHTHTFLISPSGFQCQSVSHSVMSNSVTPWTVACKDPLSMRFAKQEYWSG